jgi:hypothetical protein
MGFNHSVFWSAFKRAGMLDEAYRSSISLVVPIDVRFSQPDMLVMEGMVQTAEYEIEYQTADMLTLRIDEQIIIGSVTYKVRGNPVKVGDGYFSKAQLTKS